MLKRLLLPYLVLSLAVLAGCSRPTKETTAENVGNSPQQQAAEPPGTRQPAAPPMVAQPAHAADTPSPVFRVPEGTTLRVRLDQTLDTKWTRPGDTFTATLIRPVVANQRVVIPRGTRFAGRVAVSEPSGRLMGRAEIRVRLVSFRLNGRTYRIASTSTARFSRAHKRRNIAIIGGGSGVGGIIGGIAGGGAGAVIGAAAGAAAGTAGAAATGRLNVVLPAESQMVFRLERSLHVEG
jgi:hypothetical protein